MSKYKKFHEIHGLKQCIRCHGPISDKHHLYCDRCHRYNELDRFAYNLNKLVNK